MSKKLIAAVTLSLFALTNIAQAADYYIVAPMTLSGSGVQSDSSSSSSMTATLNETTLPVAYVNEAYSYDMKQLLVVTGDSELDLSQSTWEAIGALPDGMVLGTNGVFSGTPTSASPSEGTPFTVKATYKTASDEQVYYLQINFPVSVALASATLPTAQVGQAYSYDFKQLMDIISDPNENPSLAEFSAVTALPDGLTLGVDGVLSGTPTQDSSGASFTIRVHYKTAMAEHTYTQTVTLPIAVSLASATLPAAQVGQAYTYDMSPLATISNDSDPQPSQVTFEAASALPAGLTLAANGTLSGTPTTADPAASFTVMVTYKTAAAQRTYALEVKVPIGVALSTASLPEASLGQAYSYDLKPLLVITNDSSPNPSLATWTADASVPAGLSVGTNGQITGTPTSPTPGTNFQVTATYKGSQGQQVYRIIVNGTVLYAKQISGGVGHTCAVTLSDGVKCWGWNDKGQLGDNTLIDKLTPVSVVGLSSGVESVAAGNNHTCAKTTAGGVKCWGYNVFGQLGDGTTVDKKTPVDVVGLTSGVVQMDSRVYHGCALTTAGGVKCWGYNAVGQVGDGTTVNKPTPVQVSGMASGVASIDVGVTHTCAVTTAGAAKCWGYNYSGQIGDGTKTNRSVPTQVTGLTSGIAQIDAGNANTCALTTGGGVKCWGVNNIGQIGDGTVTERLAPTNVTGLTSGVIDLDVGNQHACAVTSANALKCWGGNTYGQLGIGTQGSQTYRTTATDVPGFASGVSKLAAGNMHTCVITDGSLTYCWGLNDKGQIGDNTKINKTGYVGVKP